MHRSPVARAVNKPKEWYERASPASSDDRGHRLGAETVKGAALALESVDDVERGDGLALGVLGVGDGVTDDVLELGCQRLQPTIPE